MGVPVREIRAVKTKDKILEVSIDLFNRSGVVAITTNHIARELDISPGNLYFHYENKEHIVRNLFEMMCEETYELWLSPRANEPIRPVEVIQKNFEVFWKYRFFHREMYYMRRKDPELAKMWRAHMNRIVKLMRIMYRRWMRVGWFRRFDSFDEMDFMAHALLATASNYLQVFESSDRRPSIKHLESGVRFVIRLLLPYALGTMKEELEAALRASEGALIEKSSRLKEFFPEELTDHNSLDGGVEDEILPKASSQRNEGSN